MGKRLCPLAAQNDRRATALETDERRWSYSEADFAVHQLALHLKTLGVEKGARVAFVARTEPSTIFLLFALWRLQAIACPLSFREPAERYPFLLDRLGATHFLESLPLASGQASTQALLSEEALCTYLFTSGTSGTPKIACHTLGNHIYNALGAAAFLHINASARYLLSLPLFHVGGLAILFRVFLSGGTIVLSQRPLTENLATLTHLSLVSTQLYRLLKNKDLTASDARILIGGAPLPLTLEEEAKARGLHLIVSYGMTEMSSLILAGNTVLPYRELCVKDTEIFVRGKTLFSGYLGTGAPELEEGWFGTRDLGEWAQDGSLRILGRKDRLFISGGENIQPEEIERALCTLPGILFARVEPTFDPEFGQRPIATILDTTQKHTLETVRHQLMSLLPGFKLPVRLFSSSFTDKICI
jgi:O-succinylbenzoic acid--CoA ligase